MTNWRLVIAITALFVFVEPPLAFSSSNYVVKKGDTLYKIAKQFKVSPKDIRAENGLKSNIIGIGKSLRIPDKKAPEPSRGKEEEAGRTPPNESVQQRNAEVVAPYSENRSSESEVIRILTGPPQFYRVRKGDTFWSLSRGFGVQESDLRRLNRLQDGKALRAGALIMIREVIPETYTVMEGDSLIEIARKFGMEIEELMVYNDLDFDVLTPGKQLVLYERDEPEPDAAIEKKFAAAAEEGLTEAALSQDDDAKPIQERVAGVAKKMLFTPYTWGGTSLSGMDCSGFVWKVFSVLDMKLPRSARDQYQVGVEVSRKKLSVGDLVFFSTYSKGPSHVGIYLGDDQFIHASSGSRRVKISSMDHPYYTKRYVGARRYPFDEGNKEKENDNDDKSGDNDENLVN